MYLRYGVVVHMWPGNEAGRVTKPHTVIARRIIPPRRRYNVKTMTHRGFKGAVAGEKRRRVKRHVRFTIYESESSVDE
jgi:hypothetical protein